MVVRAYIRDLCLCAGLLGMGVTAGAQIVERGHARLEGEITPAAQASGLTVELYDIRNHTIIDRTSAGLGGRFDFSDLPEGDFTVRLTDGSGNVITQNFVRVNSFANFVTMRLPERNIERPPTGTVSLAQLQHKVPKQARKLFEKAAKATKKGDNDEAIRCLKEALEIDPEYMEAHVNLAARLMHKNQVDEAVPHLERAIELDPAAAPAYLNLGIAYMYQGKAGDAERAAREAVKLDPVTPTNRYVLGVALAALNQDEEAMRFLRAVENEVPRARITIAQIHAQRGNVSDAADELRKYLAVAGNADNRAEVESMLTTLDSKGRVD